MGEVLEIAICKNKKDHMIGVQSVFVESGNGIVNDRYYKKREVNDNQITLIESEKINIFNKSNNINIPYINFRRNIITKGVELNDLLNIEFSIGNIKIKAKELCQPCKRLGDELKQKYLVKEMYNKSGLRCEIITDGKIIVGDKIIY